MGLPVPVVSRFAITSHTDALRHGGSSSHPLVLSAQSPLIWPQCLHLLSPASGYGDTTGYALVTLDV